MISTNQITPAKSSIDERQYRFLELDNKLKVLLISDAEAELAAASMNVNIGSKANPTEWLGLAHFLEHMLFLGTAKYPQAGEYLDFIEHNGGSHNAYTSPDSTNYFFSIAADQLEPALDRFAQFFIAPTFTAEYVERERQVVHSEYELRKSNEFRRVYSANSVLLNPDYPGSQFSIGTSQTLRDKESQSARDALIAFYQAYYSANLMGLVVVGPQSLDTLEQWVHTRFAEINNNDVPYPQYDMPYFASQDQRFLQVQAEKDIFNLSYTFELPSVSNEYRSSPFVVVSSIIGDESEGSLLAYLKQEGWATALSVWHDRDNRDRSLFSISIELTPAGVDNTQEITTALFALIKRIKEEGVTEWRYNELQTISQIQFENRSSGSTQRLASSLSPALSRYAPEDVLIGSYLMETFDADRTQELLSYLTPENMSVTLVSKDQPVSGRTAFFDVGYTLSAFDPLWLEAWENVALNPQIQLPQKNPFVPERLTITQDDTDSGLVQLTTDSNLEVWYEPDGSFKSPKANFFFTLMSPDNARSTQDQVMLNIWSQLLEDALAKLTYAADVAGLQYVLYSHSRGITFKVTGFEDKQTQLLQALLDAVQSQQFTQEAFARIKEKQLRKWRDFPNAEPATQMNEAFRRFILPQTASFEAKAAALEDLDLMQLLDWRQAFLENLHVRVLVNGDVSEQGALDRAVLVDTVFEDSELLERLPLPEVTRIDGSAQMVNLNIDHNDSLLSVYYQMQKRGMDSWARVRLLEKLMGPYVFNELRTKRKAGYLVQTYDASLHEDAGLGVLIQSPVYSPAVLFEMLNEAVDGYTAELNQLTPEAFAQAKTGLITQLTAKEKSIFAKGNRYWQDLEQDNCHLACKQQLAAYVDAITLNELKSFFEQEVLNNSNKLVVQSLGDGAEQPTLIPAAGFTVVE